MLDREAELDAFKKLNLSTVASAFGYAIDNKKSTKHSVLMSNGSDKIIVSQNDDHYVFCSTSDSSANGTAIDFAQQVIEKGCSLGRVRQLLRPFLNSGYLSTIEKKYTGRYASEIKPSEVNLAGVNARYNNFIPIAKPHPYLCDVRAVPFELLQSPRLAGKIRMCQRTGAIVFPHYGSPSGESNAERELIGFEIKGPAINMFAKGGKKGLWMSAAMKHDDTITFCESGLDAVSYLALQPSDRVRVVSLSGRMNPQQPALVRSAIERMGQGAMVCAGFDNDTAGDELTERLAQVVNEVGRKDIEFKDDRPQVRSFDWNKVLVDEAIESGRNKTTGLSYRR